MKSLCADHDVILLQETGLLASELEMLNTIDSCFHGKCTSSIDLTSGILRGRPYGGLDILYCKTMSSSKNH